MGEYTSEYYNANFMIGFTSTRGTAWHNREGFTMADGFDNNYPGAIPAQDIERRLFNWTPTEAKLYAESSSGLDPIPGKKAIRRGPDGPILGIHGEDYQVHDYKQELVHNLDEIVGADGLGYANAGLLKDGKVAYVQIELPESVKTSDGSVEVRPFILGATSLDGSLSSMSKLGYTNTVCDNTFDMFLREAGKVYRRRHSKNSDFNLASARQALDLLDETAISAVSTIDHLLSVGVSPAEWSKFVEAHVPLNEDMPKRSITLAESKRAALTSLYRVDERVSPWAGTAWGVVQAVNTYNEHLAIVRNSSRYERKMTNVLSDATSESDRKALTMLGNVMDRDLLSV